MLSKNKGTNLLLKDFSQTKIRKINEFIDDEKHGNE